MMAATGMTMITAQTAGIRMSSAGMVVCMPRSPGNHSKELANTAARINTIQLLVFMSLVLFSKSPDPRVGAFLRYPNAP